MLQRSLYLTRNIRFILFSRMWSFFRDMSDVRGRGEGFPKFGQFRSRRGEGTWKLMFYSDIFYRWPHTVLVLVFLLFVWFLGTLFWVSTGGVVAFKEVVLLKTMKALINLFGGIHFYLWRLPKTLLLFFFSTRSDFFRNTNWLRSSKLAS